MIKPNELRIGNYVYEEYWCNDNRNYIIEPLKIESIFKSHIVSNLDNAYNYEDIKPIPLTKEILLKCGFEINKTHCTKWTNDINTFIISERENKTWFLCDTDVDTSFKYLHQLQNIYFAFKQKELEINFNN